MARSNNGFIGKAFNLDGGTTRGFTSISSIQQSISAGYTVSYLVVAGGAGGGGGSGGGGGAGGLLSSSGIYLSPRVSYTITVGAGGAGGTSLPTTGANG